MLFFFMPVKFYPFLYQVLYCAASVKLYELFIHDTFVLEKYLRVTLCLTLFVQAPGLL